MSARSWNAAPTFEDDDQSSLDRPTPTLVSLHFIRTTLRRRRVACVLAALLGLLVATTYIVAFPTHQAKASLFLTHSPDVASTDATTTDVSLLKTRTVAAETTKSLGLAMPPDEFIKGVKFESDSSELMTLTLSAPTEAEAVRRLEALTSVYLKFRSEQLSLQSEILVEGMQQRVTRLQRDVEALSRVYEKLSADGNTSKLTGTISQRAYLQGQIEALQESIQDVTLQNSAVVSSSRVLDPPAAEPGLGKRSIVLGLASGLIGGAALGCGTVLFFAITSNRLRRRADIASALGVGVPISVGRIAPVANVWRWFPPLTAVDRRRTNDRQRLAHVIEAELLAPPASGRLVVAGLDNADELGFAVSAAANNLAARDYSVTTIDLSDTGSRGLADRARVSSASSPPTVLRPRELPALAHDVADLLVVGQWDDGGSLPQPPLGDATLVLADLDPAVGVDHLTAWADSVVLVITAGRSSVEKVRTVAEMVRAAGLDLRFAALLRTERSDESSGLGEVEDVDFVPLRQDEDRPEPTEKTEAR